MDPDPRLPESVRMVLLSFDTPANLPFARELWTESATAMLPQLRIPALVLIGRRDLQVDVDADGRPLQRAAEGMANVSFRFPEHANHVLKEDLRSFEERAAAPGAGYNEPGTRLDPEALEQTLGWLRAREA
ncbi:MAG: hypothetical protein J0H64_00400 [Actinobacteria bacterium]|nr:hypothetical protein [Actinomycetota bacterium]